MEHSNWIQMTSLPIPGLEWIRDLVSFDGPLLSEFRSASGDTYLFGCGSFRRHETGYLTRLRWARRATFNGMTVAGGGPA